MILNMSSPDMTSWQSEQVSTLLDDLATYREKDWLSANGTRVEMIAKARSLITTLETPVESTLRMHWEEVSAILVFIVRDANLYSW